MTFHSHGVVFVLDLRLSWFRALTQGWIYYASAVLNISHKAKEGVIDILWIDKNFVKKKFANESCFSEFDIELRILPLQGPHCLGY